MRVLVAGTNGQVATALAEAGPRAGIDVVRLGRPGFDLARPETLRRGFEEAAPDAVVNAAAYTAVDRAESEPEAVFAVNRDGAAALARLAAARGLPFVHLSTDYVFSGDRPGPHREDDPVGPQGVYGRSKLEGEQAVLKAHPGAVILRTAWVHAPYGHNFVRTVLRLASERDRLQVVCDQRGSPTYAPHIADGIVAVLRQLRGGHGGTAPSGVFHMAGAGETTWCGFARAILDEAASYGRPAPPVEAIPTAAFPTPARRPADSRLDCSKLAATFHVALPHWRSALSDCIARLLPENDDRKDRQKVAAP